MGIVDNVRSFFRNPSVQTRELKSDIVRWGADGFSGEEAKNIQAKFLSLVPKDKEDLLAEIGKYTGLCSFLTGDLKLKDQEQIYNEATPEVDRAGRDGNPNFAVERRSLARPAAEAKIENDQDAKLNKGNPGWSPK